MSGKRLPHLYSAAYLMIRRQGSILMSQRFNTGFMDGWYTLPAGHVRAGERIADAAVREAKEETNLDIDPRDVRITSVIHRNMGKREYMDVFVSVEGWKGEVSNPEPDKCSDLRFFPMDALPEKTLDYVRKGIDASLSGIPFNEHGWPPRDPKP